MKGLRLAAALVIVAAAAPARGQLIAACRGDVQRLCTGMEPGGGRLIACLEQNAAKLSPGCKQAIGASEGAAAPAPGGTASPKTACRGDAMRLCPDAVGKPEAMKKCMQGHAAELSEGCRTALIAGGE